MKKVTLKLANLCIQVSDIPEEWRHALLYPIPKTMDWEYSLIKTRLIILLDNHAGLPERSTEAPLRIINTCIEDAKKNNKELWLTFQDLSKAYDGVDIKMLKLALRRIKIPEMITNKKLDKEVIEVNFGSSKRMVKPLTSKESVRILGVWINLDLKSNFVFNQCKDIISKYNKIIRSKQIMDLQMKYVYNHVIIPRIDYKAQLLVWSNIQVEKLNTVCRYVFKRKASLPLTTPNSVIHLTMGYGIKDINTIQAQRQLSRVYNQVIAKGVMKEIFELNCKQLQSELLHNKSPLETWNISLKDLQVKHCLLA
ncbi:hypothetical protein RhiirA1_476465 [Rhizophagus irregularis]|uniref:Uncharacterized protein n=1 Tax=Rhizophagus irregularis TaxID=588596 RepID=A0A2I1F1U4_9GLOM|nr:hypothetical protein RhiirA1_476465 [Rhizophagus irregularis]PKY28331.1 hypothetical protein RhiirB3_444439 [Rhizophagus irregularis]